MSLKYDNIVDRSALRGRLFRWKLAAFLLLVIVVLFLSTALFDVDTPMNWGDIGGRTRGDIIARVSVDDFIGQDSGRDNMLDTIKTDRHIKAVLVKINSSGGASGASELLYRKLLNVGKVKPVVVALGTTAASGGYLVALAGDYIIAGATTLTGSIGVAASFYNISELAKKVGVKSTELRTSEFKASPSFFSDMSDATMQAWKDTMKSTYDYFASVVVDRRKLSSESVAKIADGRVYTGTQALHLGLIDAIGDEDDAVQWLKDNDKSIVNPVVRDIKPKHGFNVGNVLGKKLVAIVMEAVLENSSGGDSTDTLLLMHGPKVNF